MKGPTQRALRVGELVRHALAGPVLLLVPAQATAEVCDKAVGESWRTEDGPVWLLNPAAFPFAVTMLVGGLVVVAAARLPWLAYFAAVLLTLCASVVVFADLLPEQDIYLAQIREGCRSRRTDLLTVALTVVFALAYVLLGYRAHRAKISGQAP